MGEMREKWDIGYSTNIHFSIWWGYGKGLRI